MDPKRIIIVVISALFLAGGIKSVYAVERTQKTGLFSMDIPEGWRWVEYAQEIVITYPDGNNVAIDIQMVPSQKLSLAQIKKTIIDSDQAMKKGIIAHQGSLIDDKEIKVDGVFATQMDFKASPQNPVFVTNISFFNKGYAFTITYGSRDEKMRLVLDDVVATFKFR